MKQLLKNYLSLNKNFVLKSRVCLTISFIALFICIKAQVINYVNNPGFEISWINESSNPFDACENWEALDSLKSAYYVLSVTYGNAPYCATGFQQPRTGNNFILTQLYCNTCPRWYPRNRLKQNLKPNTAYCAKYHIVNTNNNRVAIDSYGLYVGDYNLDTISQCTIPLTYLNPNIENGNGNIITDTLKWIPITGTFVASGSEKYLVLGNFRTNSATNTLLINPPLQVMSSDIYIDDVSIIELDLSAFAGNDAFIPPGDSAFIGRQPDVGIDEACTWYKLPNLSVPIATIAGMWVKPVTTTTYVVRQEICGNVKWDTVVVHESGVGIEAIQEADERINIYPIPTEDEFTLQILDNKIQINHYCIYNQFGQMVIEEAASLEEKKMLIRTTNLPTGIYLIVLKKDKETVAKKRFVVTR